MKAVDIIFSPDADPDALNDLWLSHQFTATEGAKARDDYRKLAELNRKRGAWLHGGRKQTKQEKKSMLRHIHKLRSLRPPASFELVENITGLLRRCAHSWYGTWLKKQDPGDLTRWASEASNYKDDWKGKTSAGSDTTSQRQRNTRECNFEDDDDSGS